MEFVSRLRHELVHCVHSALTPVRVRLVSYWLNEVMNRVDRGVIHWLIGDFRGFRTHAMHRSSIILFKASQKILLTAFSGRLVIHFASNSIKYILFEFKLQIKIFNFGFTLIKQN